MKRLTFKAPEETSFEREELERILTDLPEIPRHVLDAGLPGVFNYITTNADFVRELDAFNFQEKQIIAELLLLERRQTSELSPAAVLPVLDLLVKIPQEVLDGGPRAISRFIDERPPDEYKQYGAVFDEASNGNEDTYYQLIELLYQIHQTVLNNIADIPDALFNTPDTYHPIEEYILDNAPPGTVNPAYIRPIAKYAYLVHQDLFKSPPRPTEPRV
jgi:hypothetical protein